MKAYGGVAVYLHSFLTSALDGVSESSVSRRRQFTRGKIVLSALPIRTLWRRDNFFLQSEIEQGPLGSPARSVVCVPTAIFRGPCM
jgi:hypothetical protein